MSLSFPFIWVSGSSFILASCLIGKEAISSILLDQCLRPVYNYNFCCDFQCDFHPLIDVNEWINDECAECMLRHLNICDWFTRSHPSNGENRTRNRSECSKCNQSFCDHSRNFAQLNSKL